MNTDSANVFIPLFIGAVLVIIAAIALTAWHIYDYDQREQKRQNLEKEQHNGRTSKQKR